MTSIKVRNKSSIGKIYEVKISEFMVITFFSIELCNTNWATLDSFFYNKPTLIRKYP
jgi:hypothetical protein